MRSSSFGVITFFWLQLFSGQLYMLLVGSYCLHLISLPTIFSYEHRQLFKSSSVKVVFRLPIMPTLGCPLCHRHQLFSPFDLIIHPIKNISIFRQQIYIKNKEYPNSYQKSKMIQPWSSTTFTSQILNSISRVRTTFEIEYRKKYIILTSVEFTVNYMKIFMTVLALS